MDDERRETELEKAACAGDLEKLKEAVADYKDFDAKSEVAIAAFESAVENGHWAMVQYLVEDVNFDMKQGHLGALVLHHAIIAGRIDVMTLVLERGVDVRSRAGSTALLSAAANGKFDIVKFLVSKGVDVTSAGGQAAWGAAKNGFWDIVAYIIEQGVDLLVCGIGVQLFAFATVENQKQISTLLDETGVKVQSSEGVQALLRMSSTQEWADCRDAVRYLLNNGVDVKQSGAGDVVIMTAAMYGDLATVQLLVESGVDVKSEAVGKALASVGLLSSAEDQNLVRTYLEQQGAVAPQPPVLVTDDLDF